jgi:hypothetical protein
VDGHPKKLFPAAQFFRQDNSHSELQLFRQGNSHSECQPAQPPIRGVGVAEPEPEPEPDTDQIHYAL